LTKFDFFFTQGLFESIIEVRSTPFEEKMGKLTEELKGQMEKEVELNEEIKKQLNKIGIKI
jgi:type I restriction enzyme M protein